MASIFRPGRNRSNWSWQVKARRILWAPFGILFLRGTTRFLSPVRVLALRIFGADITRPVLIMDGVRVWYPWNLRMGFNSAIGSGAEIYNFAPVVIGDQATVSQYAFLCTATHDYSRSDMPLVYHPIEIGSEAWVAAGAFVGPGVTIGTGAVVGARAVVTRDVAAWMVVVGNPARPVRRRVVHDAAANELRERADP